MKVVVDAVHGQIYIPKDYCKCIIDTPFFQLDLPQKSQEKKYKFFYFFVPRIFNKKDGKEVEESVYHNFYTKNLQREIENFSCANTPVTLV